MRRGCGEDGGGHALTDGYLLKQIASVCEEKARWPCLESEGVAQAGLEERTRPATLSTPATLRSSLAPKLSSLSPRSCALSFSLLFLALAVPRTQAGAATSEPAAGDYVISFAWLLHHLHCTCTCDCLRQSSCLFVCALTQQLVTAANKSRSRAASARSCAGAGAACNTESIKNIQFIQRRHGGKASAITIPRPPTRPLRPSQHPLPAAPFARGEARAAYIQHSFTQLLSALCALSLPHLAGAFHQAVQSARPPAGASDNPNKD